jgi:hypothetical protein
VFMVGLVSSIEDVLASRYKPKLYVRDLFSEKEKDLHETLAD